MNCPEARRLQDAYLDGELDLVRSLEIEDHLRQCPACAAACQSGRALSHALRAAGLRTAAPPALAERIRAATHAAARPASSPAAIRRAWLSLAAAALVAVSFATGWLGDRLARQPREPYRNQIVAAHIRSLQADHLTDVDSSDRHTVKPWFNGKLDFAVPATDLADAGFELVGGRLDVLDMRQVAALVYRRRRHVINLFVQPAARANETGRGETEQQGYRSIGWTAEGMDYWAVSDLNAGELREFVEQFQSRQRPAPSP
jgi:anti-sigma factor RsiW